MPASPIATADVFILQQTYLFMRAIVTNIYVHIAYPPHWILYLITVKLSFFSILRIKIMKINVGT